MKEFPGEVINSSENSENRIMLDEADRRRIRNEACASTGDGGYFLLSPSVFPNTINCSRLKSN